ncbi:phospholipid transfer protein C2CD2L-like isoform X3 [Apostichopus japonicus]|uniref:phospholipid transfer protein C2CD2L-like isoform X3 n=1 Tax=Stichopus japonicus TaxID=307972 RepID=UPI003AB83700
MTSSSSAEESGGSFLADVALFLHDIRMGNVNVLDVYFLFWILATVLVYLGFTLYDQAKAIKTRRKTELQSREVIVEPRQTTSNTPSVYQSLYNDGYSQMSSPGSDFTHRPGGPSSGAYNNDWVNSIAQWIYSQQSLCTPQQVSSSWLKALNDEAKRQGSSVQVTFEAMALGPVPPKFSNITIETEPNNVLTVTCDLQAEGIDFGVFASQHTASTVKVSNCNATVQKLSGKLKLKVQCIIRTFGEDWHITATLEEDTVLHLKITPQITQNESVDIHAMEAIIRNAILSATFTTVIPTRALPRDMATLAWSRQKPSPPGTSPSERRSDVSGSNHVAAKVPQEPRLLVRVIKANNLQRHSAEFDGDPYCVVTLDQPFQRHKTNFIKNTTNPFWDEQFLFHIVNESGEITFEVHDRGHNDRFQGGTTLPLASIDRSRGSRHIIQLQSRPAQNDNVKGSIVLFLLFMQNPDVAKKPLSPSRKIEKKQMLAPDGTIITTVTTKTSRPKYLTANNNEIPTKVYTDRAQTIEHAAPMNGSMSPGSPDRDGYWTPTSGTATNGLSSQEVPQVHSVTTKKTPSITIADSGRESPHSRSAVADTAIRHFQEQQALESNQKTPTKKSTLIIHGVSESPTDDYSNLQDSTDDSKISETMTRGNSSKASKRRFLFFRRKSKDGGGGKGSSRSSSFDESSVSSRSPEPQLRRAKTLDIPDSDVSGSIASEKSPKKKKKRFLGFIRRKKPKERQYHSSINLKTETEDATMSDTPTATRQKSVNTLKVPASNQYTRSASTGDIKYERYLTVDREPFRQPAPSSGSQISVDRLSYTESNV